MLSKGTVIGVRHKTIVQGESVDKRVKELYAERDELWQTLRVKSDDNAALGKELQMVEAYEKQFVGSLNQELKAVKDLRSKWGSGLSTFRESKIKLNEQVYENQLELNEIQRKINIVDKQLSILNVQPNQQSLEATVLTSCTGNSSVKA